MSYSIDTNLLVYASDAGSPHHAAARGFLTDVLASPEPCYLTWPVLMAWLRLVTSTVIMRDPFDTDEATAALEQLVAQPSVRMVTEREGFVADYRRRTRGLAVRGALVPDAHLAVTLGQHGVRTLYTNDRDFLRFDWLTVRFPLAA